MPRLVSVQTNFTTGEASDKLYGRVDIAKYNNALSVCLNFLVQPQGGVIRRPGTRYAATAKYSDRAARVLPFEFSTTQAYILEVGDYYIRFHKNGAPVLSGGVPVEVTTPYGAADVFGLDIRQQADVVYFTHPSFPTYKLERYSDTLWRFRSVNFAPQPTYEYGARPVFAVTPSAISGVGITLTSAGDAFLASDVARDIVITAGTNAGARATIKTFVSKTQVTADVQTPFVDLTANAAGSWKITASPQTFIVASAVQPVGQTKVVVSTTLEAFRGFTGLADSDCGKSVILFGGAYEITKVVARNQAQATIRGRPTGAANQSGQLGPGTWTLEEPVWSALNGYPETATFFQDRLYLGASFRFAGSKTGDYENFGVGALDDDAVVFAINSGSGQVDQIRWMVGAKSLLIGTAAAEFVADGSNGAPIKPSSVDVVSHTTYGSNGVPPQRVDNVVLFVTRSGRRLRELVFNFQVDGYVAEDLLLLAEHLTATATITDLSYQRDPDSRLWLVRSDGTLLACTYLRSQNVVAWSRHITGAAGDLSDGTFESVATIPHRDGDRSQTWVLVKRVLPGLGTVRYIEYLDDSTGYYDQRHTDACVLYSGVSTNTVTGLSHLEGQTVKVQADGSVRSDATVSGGSVTFDGPAATKVEVGLSYTSEGRTMSPEIPIGGQSLQPMKRRWARLFARLRNTAGISLGTTDGTVDAVPFRRPSHATGTAVPLYSGDKDISHLGLDDGRIIFRQTQPLPCNVLMVGGVLDVGGA